MAAQDLSLAHLQEQFALYQHIQSYHWLADTWQWKEMSQLLAKDVEFEFDYVPSEADQAEAGGIQLRAEKVIGAENVVAMFDNLVKPFKKAMHVIVNTNFNISGSTATGTANILFYGTPDLTKPHMCYSMGSRYHWKFCKEGPVSPAGTNWKTSYTRVEKIWENSTLPQ
ncbi:hypothetical protein B0A52_07113 [Exophiala mesophila]|uniref:SnoaL-like domain-containing protein n=1 Tax=Exophiala mesophila TaxID=212818 RepID=A0A438MY71_EXOME|nr:hypothetical protein B0A52_07113 [Exophiala mesophila]